MEVARLRLFFALPLPPGLRASLGEWQRSHGGVEGWSRPEGLHLTLAFLGARSAEGLGSLEGVAAAVAGRHGAFSLRTARLGGFPRGTATRLLWLGLEPSLALEALAGDLRAALTASGEPFDPKPFRPHLTLARFRRAKALEGFRDPPPEALRANTLALFDSHPGGQYEPLGTYPFREV